MKKSRMFVTGDTHGTSDFHKLTSKSFPEQALLSRDDYVLICGDFGGVWSGGRKDNWILDWYDNKKFTTVFIDGNHENFDVLERYPIEQWNGGKVHRVRNNILHLMRGQVFNIGGLKIFTFGGALSIDKVSRQPHISWWPQELPSEADINEALHNLYRHNLCVDVVLTHTAPASVCKQISDYTIDDPTSNLLASFEPLLSYKKWFFGHFHQDKVINREFISVYKRVIDVKETLIR